MWLLQRKNLHKKHQLWLKIVGLCLSLHLIVLLWVFCIYRENNYMYAFAVSKKLDYSVPIVFRPQLDYSSLETPLKTEKAVTPKVAMPKPATATKAIKPVPQKAVPEKPKTTTVQPTSD